MEVAGIRRHAVVVVGAGPGGSTHSALLARKGIDVALIESENFPRFKIGESLLPYSVDILRKSGAMEVVDSGMFMRKYGAQFIDHRNPQEVYFEFQNSLDEQHPYSFEVPREDFDRVLRDHSVNCGTVLYQPERVERILEFPDHVEIHTDKGVIETQYVVDASGREALLGKQFRIRTRNEGFNNVAVFSHFTDIPRAEGRRQGDIVVGILPDKAWSWMIPFKNGVTSAGVVVDAHTYRGRQYDESFLMERFATHPTIHKLISGAKRIRPIQTAANYSESCNTMVGKRWIMVGDAATFLDPVFSTGVHVSLQSADFASDIVSEGLSKTMYLSETALGMTYQQRVLLGVQRLRSLLRLFYDTDFVPSMLKTMQRKEAMRAFTSVVGGDAWNDANELFKMNVLGPNAIIHKHPTMQL